MRYLNTVLKFGWPYLKRYRTRFFAGILLGILFGATNAGILGVSRMIFQRLDPSEQSAGSTAKSGIFFTEHSLTNSAGLIEKLRSHPDPVSEFVWSQFSAPAQRVLGDPGTSPREQNHLLAESLNLLLQAGPIYEAKRFESVKISSALREWIARSPRGDDLARLNRQLLEESYPLELPQTWKPGKAGITELVKLYLKQAEEMANGYLDPWLPHVDQRLSFRQVIGLLMLLPLMFALRGFIGYGSSYCLGWVSERVINDLRLDVLIKLNSLSLSYFNKSTVGDLLTRVNSDTNSLLRTLNYGFSDLIKEPLTVIMVVAYLFYMDWKMTLFVVFFFPLCAIPTAILGRKMKRASQGNVKATISQSSLLVELITSIRVVKAFNLEDQQVQHYRKFSWDLVHHDMKSIQARELVNPVIETISALGLGALIVWIFYTGHSVADLVVFLGGVVSIYTPIKKIAGLLVMFQQSSVGVDRLMKIMEEQSTVVEPAQPKSIKAFNQSISFEQVSFSYGNQLVVKDINLKIPRGFKLGIAGTTGSGKSTLVNLAMRFYDPTQGGIKIDGTDLRDISTRDLRQLMALVSQEVVIFDKSAAENIGCGRLGATQAEIEEAARTAYAHDFIMSLPQGYQTRLGERGVTLSGGQRQRICIARAVVRNAPILLLDEATGSLDSEVEAEVQAGIDRLAQNRTVISVAHRLSTLANCDQVIVLSNGSVIEQGGFDELLRAGGTFAGMCKRQGITA